MLYVPYLAENVELVLLLEASAPMIDEALAVVADAVPYPDKLRAKLYERREAMLAGDLPEAFWLLADRGQLIGWCGWAPYVERPNCWQTSTYFAASHRGIGLFSRARCRQLHDADVVAAWDAAVGRPPSSFLLSIADWNTRSLEASRRYAAANAWPDTWEQVFEPSAERTAHVFSFPYPAAPHRCYLVGHSG